MSGKKDDEILDLSKLSDPNWLKRTFGDVTKASAAKQIGVGSVGGWVAGYVSSKIGKAAATAVGGTLLILQVAHYKGYINVNWGKLERDFNRAKKTVGKETEKQFQENMTAVSHVKEFARQNVCLAGGFACGFLIGLAS